LSRHEGELKASTDALLTTTDLLGVLGRESPGTDFDRQRAIACFLAAGEGWKDAAKVLNGAFAGEVATTRLRADKAE
jgi:hypothetical protein